MVETANLGELNANQNSGRSFRNILTIAYGSPCSGHTVSMGGRGRRILATATVERVGSVCRAQSYDPGPMGSPASLL
jgi:hypothetical protein